MTWSLALILGALGTCLFRIGIVASGFELVPGDEGDARTLVYLAEHWYHVLLGRSTPLSPGMFYPTPGTIGYVDSMVVHALPYSLLRAAGVDMFSAMTLAVVLFDFLNYVACVILLKRVLHFTVIASCVGAMFFAFNSPRLNHPGHFNLQPMFFLPLTLGLVIAVGRDAASVGGRKALWLLSLAALSLNLQLVTALYPGWFFVFWSFLFLVLAGAVPATRAVLVGMGRRFWPALLGSSLVFGLGLWPLVLLYLPALQSVGWRPYGVVHPLIPEFWSLLLMGDGNYVWGRLSAAISRLSPHVSSTEQNIGIGLVPSVVWLAISVAALWTVTTSVRERPPLRGEGASSGVHGLFFSVAVLATGLFYLIGMRYWNDSSPWRLVYDVFPGAKGFRAPARYVMFLSLPMAIAFAVVVHRAMHAISWEAHARRRACVMAGMFAVIAFGLLEQLGRTPAMSKTAQLAWVNRLAARLPDSCSAFYAVAGPVRTRAKYEYQIDAMLVSIVRGVPTLNGYSGHSPPGWSLREVEKPGYEENVRRWIDRHRLGGHICRLEIGE